MSRNLKQIICVGHSALDRIFTVTAWPHTSAKIVATGYAETGGGMAANAAVAVARLGGTAEFWGPVGEDGIADVMREQLLAEAVDARGLRRFAGLQSSTSAILIDARGERLVVGYRGTALQAPAEWLELDRIAGAGALLADVRWPQGSMAALRAARSAGIPSVLDGDTAEHAVLVSLAKESDYVLFSEAGLASFSGTGEIEAGLRQALTLGARLALVTQGEHGVHWIDAAGAKGLQHLPAYRVTAIDTLAAGDVFHAAFALELALGKQPREALGFASAAAAIKCTRPGGRSGCPSREEVERFLREI
jgi:sulfofructose kinase